ncbi:epocide hydrolase domain-containing protein [Cladochytrium replicatum]|nr:epocide hydrolase domain-containing protein [Cladochytrium replicatum]
MHFPGRSTDPHGADAVAVQFKINVPDTVLDDLNERIGFSLRRLPSPENDPLVDINWDHGIPLSVVSELAKYWREGYDWRATEAKLNEFAHFKMYIEQEDVNVHFIHERSNRPDAKPLLLIHGWPGSFFEFHKILKRLVNPESPEQPAFHVVCPSLPGYGFSSAPRKPGFSAYVVARTLNQVMINLGYDKYISQGGDWGGIITKLLGAHFSKNCKAIHLNMVLASPKMYNPFHLYDAIRTRYGNLLHYITLEAGYSHIQATRPNTLGFALLDSPIGLLAWIVEKFRNWSDCDGDVFSVFTKDELLTNVMIYWLNGAITSSTRLYYETAQDRNVLQIFAKRTEVPTGVAFFPEEILKTPKSWASGAFNLKQWKEFPRGGHFAALEQPEALLKEVRGFAKIHAKL